MPVIEFPLGGHQQQLVAHGEGSEEPRMSGGQCMALTRGGLLEAVSLYRHQKGEDIL